MNPDAAIIFRKALQAVEVKSAVRAQIRVEQNALTLANRRFELARIRQMVIVAVGKAATTMYEAAADALAELAANHLSIEALVVAPVPPATTTGQTHFFPGSHPTPNAVSRGAAEAALTLLQSADAETLVLFLISGGASSMLELPLDSAISLADTAAFYLALVQSGLSIAEMNTVRKHFSAVKGGRLAVAAAGALAQCTLIVSDVPAAQLDVVGSGPSLPDASTQQQTREILARLQQTTPLPPSVRAFFDGPLFAETPKPHDLLFARCAWHELLSSAHLAEAAARAAEELGYHVEIDSTCDEWEYTAAARYLLQESESLAKTHSRTCILSVGEVAVRIDGPCGLGGRNQQFALWSALELERSGRHAIILSAGSDGIDGNSPAAGAVVDGTTCKRARLQGLNPEAALTGFNAYPLFQQLGDALMTGPTGNNLRDLRLILQP